MTDRSDDADDLADIEALLRELDPADLELTAPPPDVWDGVLAGIAAEPGSGAPVVELGSRRRPALRWIALAAAAIMLVVAAATLRPGDDDTVVAVATLAYDPVEFDPLGDGAAATAELVERDGRYEIRLTDATLPVELREAADLELWLIQADPSGAPVDVVTVSVIGDDNTFAIPSGLDPTTHTIVDISIEPRDGDEAHSGRSILRGPFAFG